VYCSKTCQVAAFPTQKLACKRYREQLEDETILRKGPQETAAFERMFTWFNGYDDGKLRHLVMRLAWRLRNEPTPLVLVTTDASGLDFLRVMCSKDASRVPPATASWVPYLGEHLLHIRTLPTWDANKTYSVMFICQHDKTFPVNMLSLHFDAFTLNSPASPMTVPCKVIGE
jgi:hypothetical protein